MYWIKSHLKCLDMRTCTPLYNIRYIYIHLTLCSASWDDQVYNNDRNGACGTSVVCDVVTVYIASGGRCNKSRGKTFFRLYKLFNFRKIISIPGFQFKIDNLFNVIIHGSENFYCSLREPISCFRLLHEPLSTIQILSFIFLLHIFCICLTFYRFL